MTDHADAPLVAVSCMALERSSLCSPVAASSGKLSVLAGSLVRYGKQIQRASPFGGPLPFSAFGKRRRLSCG